MLKSVSVHDFLFFELALMRRIMKGVCDSSLLRSMNAGDELNLCSATHTTHPELIPANNERSIRGLI
jgi:hypothetical protein